MFSRDFKGIDNIVLKNEDLRAIDYHMEMIYKAHKAIDVLANVFIDSEEYSADAAEGILFSTEVLGREFEEMENLINKAIDQGSLTTEN